jgi:enoyl-CoA hydratase
MVEEMHDCFSNLEQNHAIRVVILTGAGRGFCSGTDLSGGEQTHPGSNPVTALYKRQKLIGDLAIQMRRIPQPLIAAVNGVAAGGGFSFAMGCDVRVAVKSARFIASFINIGLSAGDVGSSYFLPRLIGLSRASEILLTGRDFPAGEAERCGFVSRVVEDGKSVDAALDIARQMLTKSPFGLRMTKELLTLSLDQQGMEAAMFMENRTQALAVLTGDFKIAMEAFSKKEPVQFPPEV